MTRKEVMALSGDALLAALGGDRRARGGNLMLNLMCDMTERDINPSLEALTEKGNARRWFSCDDRPDGHDTGTVWGSSGPEAIAWLYVLCMV